MSLFTECYIKIKMIQLKLGMWPERHLQKRTIAMLIFQTVFCLCAIVKNTVKFDSRTVTDALSHCNAALVVIVYYSVLIKYKDSFNKLMSDIYSDAVRDMNEIEQKYMRHAGHELRRVLKMAFYIFVSAISIKIGQHSVVFAYSVMLTTSESKFDLAPPMALPNIYNNIVTHLLESTAITLVLATIIAFMIIYVGLVVYLCAHFKALTKMMANNLCPGDRCTNEYNVTTNRKLVLCIKRHIKLIELSNIMAKIFGPILWIDCFISTINICFVLFSLVSQQTAEHFLTEFSFLYAGITQLILVNWYADRLLAASSEVGFGVYSSKWPELDLTYKRNILLIIQRSQKSNTMVFFGSFSPSMEVFVSICTSSWGYFNILRTVAHKP